MNERTDTMKEQQRGGTLTPAPWLDRARDESQRRADQAAAFGQTRPLDWDAVQAPAAGRSGGGSVGWRLTWAAALGLALLVGGATGTWAYVQHYRAEVAKKEKRARATVKAPKKVKRPPRRKRPAVTPAPVAAVEVEVEQEPTPVPAPRRKLARKARKKAKVAPAPPSVPEPPREVMFNDPSMPGGGHVIIVTPPFRMEPLFKVERYKQKGPGGSSR